MGNLDFWKDWKEKTDQEIEYIKSLEKTINLILRHIPKEKIHSIYVKGSFVKRELTPKSDIDIVIITTDSRYLKKISNFSKEFKNKIKPSEIVTPYSIWEFKHCKSHHSKKKTSQPPYLFLCNLEHHKCIYGKAVDKKKYKIPSAKKILKYLIKYVEDYIPAYYKGESYGFLYLTKQVFWLRNMELIIKNGYSPHSFEGMAKITKNKNHIINNSMKLRKMKVIPRGKDQKIKKDFVEKLKKYLSNLKKLI